MKIESGYKVVCCVDKKGHRASNLSETHRMMSYSAIQHISELSEYKKGVVRYGKGKWATYLRGCGPLTVFSNLENAISFLRCMGSAVLFCQIWECKYVPTRSTKNQVWWWRYDSKRKDCRKMSFLPTGTVLASKVKLTKKMEVKI